MLDVSMTQATLGAELEIEGLDGPERIRVEPGTESGTVVRMQGKGVPNVNRRDAATSTSRCTSSPRATFPEERKLWERLAELRGEQSSKRDAGAPASSGGPSSDGRLDRHGRLEHASSAGSRPARSRPTSFASPTRSSRSAT